MNGSGANDLEILLIASLPATPRIHSRTGIGNLHLPILTVCRLGAGGVSANRSIHCHLPPAEGLTVCAADPSRTFFAFVLIIQCR
jgi:hypothetical protein